MKHIVGNEIAEYCEQLREILSVTQEDNHSIPTGLFLGGMVFKNSQEITIYCSRKNTSSTFSIVYRFAFKTVHVAPYDLSTLYSLLSVIKRAVIKAKRVTGYIPLSSFYRSQTG